MTEKQAIAYAVLAYRRLENQEHDEECFESVMKALMATYTEEEVIKIAFRKGDKGA